MSAAEAHPTRRVLLVTTAYPPSMGGAQMHAHQLACALQEEGVTVDVAAIWRTSRTDWLRGTTVRAPGPAPTTVLDGVSVHQVGVTKRSRRKLAPVALAYYGAMRATRGALTSAYLPRLRELIEHIRPDVVHLTRIGREALYEASLTAAREHELPVVLTPNHHPSWNRRRDGWWWDIYRRVDRLLALTDAERRDLIAGGIAPERVGRTTVGIVGAPSREVVRDAVPRVLFLGQAHAYKGLDLLAEAWPAVRAANPDAVLDVVGPWPVSRGARGRLRAHLERLPGVTVHGAVDEPTKWTHLARAHVLCVPSSAEALGGVYLEAWAAGAVPVGADIPPVRELLEGSGGGRVVQLDAGDLARALNQLLGDAHSRAALVEAGRTVLAREHTWSRAAELSLAAYDRIGKRGGR